MIDLKGLYWYFKYSERIVTPLTKSGWKTLGYIADAWKYGVPEPLQFGTHLALQLEEFTDERIYREAENLLSYQRKRIEEYMAGFLYFPSGPWTKTEGSYDEFTNGKTLGWKQDYEWKPVC